MVDEKALILENPHLKVSINPKKATFSCEHKTADVIWGEDPWQGSLGFMKFTTRKGFEEQINLSSARKVEIIRDDLTVKMKLSDFSTRLESVRDDRALGSKILVELEFVLDLEEPVFTFKINKLELDSKFWSLQQVVAPIRHFSARSIEEDAYYLLPDNQGSIIPTRFNRGYFRYLNWMWSLIAGYSYNLDIPSMPFYGAVKGDSGFAAILETPFDVTMDVVANHVTSTTRPFNDGNGEVLPGGIAYSPRITAVSPVWEASYGALGYPRVCSYHFVYKANIAKLAKTYRQYARKAGYFKSLKDKIAENPNVEKLIGGPDIKVFMVTNRPKILDQIAYNSPVWDGFHEVSTTFGQLAEIGKELEGMGINRGMIHVAGWGQNGFDNWRPIDTLPVNEEAGGEAGFKAVAEQIKNQGMLLSIHDNYRNFDLNSPSFDESLISEDEYGNRIIGFSSEGGPSEQICSTRQLPLLEKNSAYMADKIGANAYFLDTTPSTKLHECYASEHPMTRKQDAENRMELLRHLKKIGLVVGGESGKFWGVPHCDFFEGMMGTHGAHGIQIPLFNLVYHDAVFAYWQHSAPYNYGHPRGNFIDKVLMGLLYGTSSTWVISSYVFPGWKRQIKDVHKRTTKLHKKIAMEEMVDFTIHSADYLVQSSEFSDGTKVAVNYSPEDCIINMGDQQVKVPFRGYVISYSDGVIESGQIEYVIEEREL